MREEDLPLSRSFWKASFKSKNVRIKSSIHKNDGTVLANPFFELQLHQTREEALAKGLSSQNCRVAQEACSRDVNSNFVGLPISEYTHSS